MNNISDNAISEILSVVLIFMIAILIFLCVWYLILKAKVNKNKKSTTEKIELSSEKNKNTKDKKRTTVKDNYNVQPLTDFMEFEKVEDNMIVQKNGKRYLMVIQCQGVNYDLMSQMEKISVEEGFQQF